MAATQKVASLSHIVTICITESRVKMRATFPINILYLFPLAFHHHDIIFCAIK